MKLGIIGKPQCGKTTVFNAASGKQEAVGDFSQASHRAVIKVPDARVDRLAEIVQPRKKTYAEIEFLDAPGFTGKGKEAGTTEINPDLRLMDALMMIIDHFTAEANPRKYIRALVDEMILADLAVIENNQGKKSRKAQLTGDKSIAVDLALLARCREALEEEKPLIECDWSDSDEKALRGYAFLTMKPLLVVLNIAEDQIPRTSEIRQEYRDFIVPGTRNVAVLCGRVEAEIAQLESEERQLFLDDMGITIPAVEKLIQRSYTLLGLISFLTTGTPEVRAWTIKQGTAAKQAAGAIHSDFERGFIRAEVATFEDYSELKTLPALKSVGKARLEGKEYVVQDGDVILFHFNV